MGDLHLSSYSCRGTGIDEGTTSVMGRYLHVADSKKKLVEDLMNVIWSVWMMAEEPGLI